MKKLYFALLFAIILLAVCPLLSTPMLKSSDWTKSMPPHSVSQSKEAVRSGEFHNNYNLLGRKRVELQDDHYIVVQTIDAGNQRLPAGVREVYRNVTVDSVLDHIHTSDSKILEWPNCFDLMIKAQSVCVAPLHEQVIATKLNNVPEGSNRFAWVPDKPDYYAVNSWGLPQRVYKGKNLYAMRTNGGVIAMWEEATLVYVDSIALKFFYFCWIMATLFLAISIAINESKTVVRRAISMFAFLAGMAGLITILSGITAIGGICFVLMMLSMALAIAGALATRAHTAAYVASLALSLAGFLVLLIP